MRMIKKCLLLGLFLLGMLPAVAQSVVYDQTSSNGVRTLICEGINLGVVNNMDVNVALAGFDYDGTVLYSLAVVVGSGNSTTIPAGGKCVLTLSNGKQEIGVEEAEEGCGKHRVPDAAEQLSRDV